IALLEKRKQRDERTALGLRTDRRHAKVDIVIIVNRQTELFKVVFALRPAGRLAGLLNRRQQQRNQDGNNGDDDKQLDQRKISATHIPTFQFICDLRRSAVPQRFIENRAASRG